MSSVLAVLLSLAVAANCAQWAVLNVPASVRLSATTPAPQLTQVEAFLADLLGLPEAQGSWSGVLSANVFSRPRAAVSIIVAGASDGLCEVFPISPIWCSLVRAFIVNSSRQPARCGALHFLRKSTACLLYVCCSKLSIHFRLALPTLPACARL